MVAEHGIPVNCGSPDMIEQYAALRAEHPGLSADDHAAREPRLRPRPQPQDQHGRRALEARHLARGAARAASRAWSAPACASTGIHVHIGSGVDLEHLALVAGAAARFARQVGRHARRRSPRAAAFRRATATSDPELDVDAYFAIWDRERKRLDAELGHRLRLEIEPGRYLVAESGWLLTEIRAVKQQGRNLFYVVDAGFNNAAAARSSTAPTTRWRSCRPTGRRRAAAARRRGRRPALRVRRHLHPGRGRRRAQRAAARGPGRRLPR